MNQKSESGETSPELPVSDLNTILYQRLRRARLGRRIAGALIFAPLILGGIAFVSMLGGHQHPDSGFLILGVIYYGLFACPLLIIPIIAYILFSRRVRALEYQLWLGDHSYLRCNTR